MHFNNVALELPPIPSYLQQFIVEQQYDEYTPQDHAVWRYIMRRNVSFLKKHAHDAYLDGLKKTGITLEHIPNIDEMNQALAKIGWRAVVVDGFVPPVAFMEFQALKILVISAEIRNINNILYTPAPDIIHEAAGHAPIIADPEYSAFLQKFGEYGMKAIFSKQDYDIYEAIRYLSIIKEFPETPESEIKQAEVDLDLKMKAVAHPSESNLLSRMHWWTVEYGLVGTPDTVKLFGAGLLSSVGESKQCLTDAVKKIPLSVDCVNYPYDITTMQPQLFVAKDFTHLRETLEAFADTMAFRIGGAKAIELVKQTQQVGTLVFSSGIQVSGIISDYKVDENGNPIWFSINGDWALASNDNEIKGFGIPDHPNTSFQTPIGTLLHFDKSLDELYSSELFLLNCIQGEVITLQFTSGILVTGKIEHVLKNENGGIQVLTLSTTSVLYKNEVLFEDENTLYTLVCGSQIVSGFSGSADKEHFPVYPPKSQRKAIKIQYTNEQMALFRLYTMVREMRESRVLRRETIHSIYSELQLKYPKEWLLRLELLELIQQHHIEDNLTAKLLDELNALKKHSDVNDNVITAGLQLIFEPVLS